MCFVATPYSIGVSSRSLSLCVDSTYFGISLKLTCIYNFILGISLPNGSNMVNNHFIDDSILYVRIDQGLIDG